MGNVNLDFVPESLRLCSAFFRNVVSLVPEELLFFLLFLPSLILVFGIVRHAKDFLGGDH